MMATTFEKGVLQGLRQAVQVLLEQRFGPLSTEAIQRLNAWPAERLDEVLRSVVKEPSLKDLGLQDD
jgi:hypothetical protein